MKVLVVNPPWIEGGRQGVRAGSRWPHLKIVEEERYMPYPFFLGYATSLLKTDNFDVKAIDAIAENISYDEFIKKVIKFKPDIVLSEVSTPSLDHDLKLLKKLKSKNNFSLAIAGPDANIFSTEFVENTPVVDFVLIGEYDSTFLELCQTLKSKNNPKDVNGIIYRSKNKVIKTKNRILKKDINNIPWPDREDFPIYNYHDCPGGIPEPSAQMWSSRGCPYQCVFCLWPQIMYNGSNYRTRDVMDVVDEMEYLVKKKGFKSIYFDDDTFNIGKDRMINLAREIRKRNLNIPWAFMGRADQSDHETIIELRKAGVHAVKYGLESGVQELINKANKNLNLNNAINNILFTKKLGIKVHLTFTFGLPGETKETVRKTINLAKYLDPDSVQFSITTPFPGTKLYEDMKEKGNIISYNWKDYDGNTKSVMRTKSLSAEDLKNAQNQAYQEWFNHKIIKQRYANNSPFTLFRICLKENGLSYTIKKTIKYIINQRYELYQKNA